MKTAVRSLGCVFACSVLGVSSSAWGEVRLPKVLGDHMVLQQSTAAALWGWANPGETVEITATWAGGKASATADAGGLWSTTIATPEGSSKAHSITFKGSSEVTLNDVLIGEVWICGGQSNMEWPVSASDNAPTEIAAADFPQIRILTVPNVMSVTARSDCDASWAGVTKETIAGFSAVGYFFGRDVHKRLGVPVGLVSCDWGGTRAECWMSPEAAAKFPAFEGDLRMLRVAADPNRRDELVAERMKAWWDAIDTLGPKVGSEWASANFDDTGWTAANLPATWAGDLAGFDGVMYYRKTIELPSEWDGSAGTLSLGPIDDRDDAWVNGTQVGATHDDGHWSRARSYTVPASLLRRGTNVIAIRCLDTSGPGGVNGMPEQMTLAPASAGVKAVGLAGEWKAKKGAAKQELPAMPGGAALNAHATPTLLYQGMVRAIAPFTPRGVIWYQGESNRDAAMQYRSLFPAVIEDWRATFKRPEMPFLFVQLAPFRYGGDKGETALVREAQARTLGVANTGMAVTMDVGNASDIHPKNKQEVGRRLALWALAKTYGKGEIVHSGPLFKSVAFEGDKARVRFEHTGTGLVARGGDLKTFLIAGEDKVFYPGVAKREGDTIMVHSPRVSKPAAVRYGWDDDCEPNLFNKEGLPASPFRSDEWKLEECALNLSAAMESLRTKEAGFKDLFDGKSLAGWVNINTAPSTWSVGKDEEGGATIRCTGIPTGVMRTEAVYENFVAELEWRHLVAGGNAGFFVWSDALTSAGVPFTRSVEVQVMDGQEGPGYTSDGDVFPIHGATMTPENGRGGQRAFPTERRMNASPNWNHYRVTCQDGTISVAVNGKVVTRGRNISPRKGHICLESEGSAIDFRNIRIKELPSAPSLAPEQVARVSENGGAWTSLYTGVDFAGWKYKASYEGHWVASDWTIHYDGKAGEDLWSEKSYKDFEMIVDWRFPGKAKELEHPVILSDGNTKKGPDGKDVMEKVQDAGDSGIYLRGSSKSQVNIWCWGIGSGEVYGYRTDGAMSAQVRAGVTPRSRADKPIGEWNRFHITMKGERLSVVLNGTKVLDEAHLPGVAPEGPIALQHHGDEVEFANLFIRELK